MDSGLKARLMSLIGDLAVKARQSVAFGHQKTDPTLIRAQAMIEELHRLPDEPPRDPDVVTMRR